MNRGFTVVEILVTLVVMTVLLTLGVFAVRSSLVDARDAERAEDISILARGLELYYDRGNPYYIGPGTTKGSYPGANEMISISGAGWCAWPFENSQQAAYFSVCKQYFEQAFPGITSAAMTPPDKSSLEFRTEWRYPANDPDTLINDWMQGELDAGKYVYKPMTSNSYKVCYNYTVCTRFALFYKKETNGEIETVWSKHQ